MISSLTILDKYDWCWQIGKVHHSPGYCLHLWKKIPGSPHTKKEKHKRFQCESLAHCYFACMNYFKQEDKAVFEELHYDWILSQPEQ
jgi:hypothetical protein